MDETTRDQIAKALGRIPSGCCILTARGGGRRTGMLASWLQQAAFDPPMVSVAVNKGRPIVKLIEESGGFVANLLGENPGPMFRHFGRGFTLEEDAFAGLSVEEVPGGVAIPDRIAWLSAMIRHRCDAGDHWLLVAEVIAAEAGDGPSPYVHIRRNGLSY